MKQLFNFDLQKIPNSSKKDALERKKSLKLFLENGFPTKKDENWKFSDLNLIITKNFKSISNNIKFELEKKIDLINDFDHNYIILVNGSFISSNLEFEDKNKVKIEDLSSSENFNYQTSTNLSLLNRALSTGGFNLEIQKDYK